MHPTYIVTLCGWEDSKIQFQTNRTINQQQCPPYSTVHKTLWRSFFILLTKVNFGFTRERVLKLWKYVNERTRKVQIERGNIS